MKRKRANGFSLLEVMVAIAILAGALTWLVVGVSRAIAAENHAKMMATATFLARGRLVEVEDLLREEGFGESEKDPECKFEDQAFHRFSCTIHVEKVELPSSEQLQTVLSSAQQAQQTLRTQDSPLPLPPATPSGSSDKNALGGSASLLASQFEMVKNVLEQAIRRVTVKVVWLEGKRIADVTVVTYLSDVKRVDAAIGMALPK